MTADYTNNSYQSAHEADTRVKKRHFKNVSSYFSKPRNPVVSVGMPNREKDKNTTLKEHPMLIAANLANQLY